MAIDLSDISFKFVDGFGPGIARIENAPVIYYKEGEPAYLLHRIKKIFDRDVIYDETTDRIASVGEWEVVYLSNGQIDRIGDLKVLYHDNSVERCKSHLCRSIDHEPLRISKIGFNHVVYRR